MSSRKNPEYTNDVIFLLFKFRKTSLGPYTRTNRSWTRRYRGWIRHPYSMTKVRRTRPPFALSTTCYRQLVMIINTIHPWPVYRLTVLGYHHHPYTARPATNISTRPQWRASAPTVTCRPRSSPAREYARTNPKEVGSN